LLDERRVLERLKRGDRHAFGEIVDAYQTRAFRMAMRYAVSPSDAEDIVQEAFVGIYKGLQKFRGESALSTWIYRVILNHCLEYRRKRRLDSVPIDEETTLMATDRHTDPQWAAEYRADSQQLENALSQLSPAHRDVVILHELQGLTYQECADVLQVPVGTVKSRLFHAFNRLRQAMGVMAVGEA
jgi:RNA polymerase sigma-70 factor (ECF subfamily)